MKSRIPGWVSSRGRSAHVIGMVAFAWLSASSCGVYGISEPGTLSTLTISPSSQTLAVNGTQQFTAVGKDFSGGPVAVTPTWTVVAGGGTISSSGLFTAGTTPQTYANTVTATSAGLSSTATVIVTAGPLATIAITPNLPSLVIGATQQFTAVGKDASGNVVTITPVWSVVTGGGSIDAATGIFTAGEVTGTYTNTVTATSGTISGTATVTVTAGALATIAVTPNPASLGIGATQQFTAVGKDAGGNVVSITPTWSVVAGGGTISNSGLFTAGTTPQTYVNTVTATSAGLSSTATVIVTAGPLATITITPNPASLVIGATQQFTAVGKDAGGNVVAITPVWSVVNGGGSIDTATGLFTAGAVTGTYTNSITVTSGMISGKATVTVTAGALATIAVTPNPASLGIGATQQFTAVGKDAGGNVVSITPTWSVVAGGGTISSSGLFTSGTAAGTFTNTVVATSGTTSGAATVVVTAGPLASITVTPDPASVQTNGTQQFAAIGKDAGGNVVPITPAWSVVAGGGSISSSGLFTAGAAAGTFTNTVKATSGTIAGMATVNVTAGALATIAVTPNPASLIIGATQQFTAVGRDAGGNVVAITPAWSVVAGGGTINSSGLFTAGAVAGTFTNTVTATSGAISGTATVIVTAGTLASITVTPNPASLGIGATQQFTAVGKDAGGNVVLITPVWSVVNGGGSINGSGLFTAGTVAGTFSNTVTATSGGHSSTATVVVTAEALASITVTPAPASVQRNDTQQFSAVGKDASGNIVSITPVWSVVNGGGSIDASTGLFTAGAATGTFANTVTATSGMISKAATVTVTAGPLATITVTPNPTSLGIRATRQFTAVGRDAGGNVVSIAPLWSVVADGGSISSSGLFTAGTVAGTFDNTITATSGTISGTATVTVTAGPLATITVTPDPASVQANATQQFTAVGKDANGNVVSITPDWSVVAGGGTINDSGLFTGGPVTGTFTNTVKATRGPISATATVTVTAGPVATITVTPNPASVQTNGTQQFSAVGNDADGNVVSITPVWSVVAAAGSISSSGLFTAGAVAGTFTNAVTATSGTISRRATVTVIAGALATIAVTPNPASLGIGATQQFTAVGKDANGNVVPIPPLTWSVVAGGGSISNTGLFTAGAVAGTFTNTVTATSGAISGTATVTVTAGPLATITVTPNPASLGINTAQQFAAVGKDANGNVVPITSLTWSVVAGVGTINGAGLFTAGTTAGTFTNAVAATSGTISGAATVTVTAGALATITVMPNPATLAINTTQQFTAVGKDAGGNVVPVTPVWSVVNGGGTIDAGTGLFTAGAGAGTFTNTVTATSGAISGTATVTVTAGPLATITVTPNPATLAIKTTQQFTAVGTDAGGNVVSIAPTWSVVAGGGTIDAGTGLFTAGAVAGTFTNTVTATSGTISGTATVTVTAGALATITVMPNPATLAISTTQQFTAVGKDAGGNVVPVTPVWSVVNGGGTIDAGTGLFTAGTGAGTFTNTVTATSGTISGAATVTVTAGALATITVMPNPATLAINTTQQFTAVGKDADGNVVPITPVWSVVNGGGSIDAGTGLFTAGTTAGTFNNTVTATSGTISGTVTVTVTPGPLAMITVTPDPASVQTNATQQFIADGRDAGGNAVVFTPTWSVVAGGGTIDAGTGLFTAGTDAGTFTNTVTATSGSISGTATVIVTP